MLLAVLMLVAVPVVSAQPVDPYAEEPAAKPAAKKKAPKEKKKEKAPPEPVKGDDGGVIDPYADTGSGTGTGTAAAGKTKALDIGAVQGLLTVQTLDGWLLYDRDGQNPLATKLVGPTGTPTRAWFYFIPDQGDPTALCHQSELASFTALPGKQVTYAGYRDMSKQLKALLKGSKSVAMEYSPKGSVPSVSRVDAGTLELVRGLGVTVKSSAGLVQFTKALWGPGGRKQHYIAVHHLTELRRDALAWLAKQIADGKTVTELDVQARIVAGMKMRDVEGPAPVVAAGVHTADPFYTPTEATSAAIGPGDLVMLSLAGRTKATDGIYAATTWVAYVGDKVPERIASAFEIASLARDEAIALITDRVKRRRAIKGYEVDAVARGFVTKANLGDNFLHRTGHAIDSDLQGAAADLDDYEIKDTRPLVVGSGFTIGPGLYFKGEYGVRAEVSAYFGPKGLEVTTPKQEAIEHLVAPSK